MLQYKDNLSSLNNLTTKHNIWTHAQSIHQTDTEWTHTRRTTIMLHFSSDKS